MMASMGRVRLCVVVGAAACLAPAPARADDVEDARRAYDQGARAYDSADFATAMRQFARADDLAPNPVALELALKSALKMNDAVTGMTLVERAERRAPSGTLSAAVSQARERFEPNVGRLFVGCPARHTCRAMLDGSPLAVGVLGWVTIGDHARDTWVDETNRRETVRVDPGATLERALPAPAAIEPAPARRAAAPPRRSAETTREPSGIAPAWFWAGAGVTAALAGAAVASGLDTNAKHDDFVASPNPDTQSAGVNARLRTNVLAGAAGAVGIVTAAVGIFAVRWGAPASTASSAPSIQIAVGETSVWLRGHY